MSITYSNNAEYRQALRKFCDMSCNDISVEYDEIDDESKDELIYDSVAMNQKMDEIFKKTKNDELWTKLYELAAAKFFSTNLEIGLTVLFSYHYFPGFYDCWISYSQSKESWSKRNEFYQILLSIL